MFADLNYVAILLITLLVFFLGFLWYGPLFGKEWARLAGLSAKDTKGPMLIPILKGLVGTFLMMTTMAYLLSKDGVASWQEGALTALVMGIGFVVPVLYSSVNWEKRPLGLFFINALYWLTVLIIAGAIYIAWTF